jgi:alpha-beta hydrolase superfamily lysophospholipase
MIKNIVLGSGRHVLKALGYGLVGAFIVLIVVAVLLLDGRPDLEVWHSTELDLEYTVDSDVHTFSQYLTNEKALFEQLNQQVYSTLDSDDGNGINRFRSGSLSDPGVWPINWNRSFELIPDHPAAAAVLIHGMSDSPYSMRSIARRLHEEGVLAVGLRVPGHGTAPSGLLHIEWEDMAAAVRLAVRYASEKAPGKPLYLIGYSNGAALAVEHALAALTDDSLPRPDRLVLLSASIGVSPLAAFAVWQERLGHLLGLEKIAWNSLGPEYDPYKYNSFALNAAIQVHRLTSFIKSRAIKLADSGELVDMPPILAVHSAVDSTVIPAALLDGLMSKLQPGDHQLLVYDLNRSINIESILSGTPTAWIDGLLDGADRPFAVSIMTNLGHDSPQIMENQRLPGELPVMGCPSDLEWPIGVFSMSHVSLPFPKDDPVYGAVKLNNSPGIQLGMLALRGENRVLRVSPAEMLRLRWNPFHEHMLSRITAFMNPVTRSLQPCWSPLAGDLGLGSAGEVPTGD